VNELRAITKKTNAELEHNLRAAEKEVERIEDPVAVKDDAIALPQLNLGGGGGLAPQEARETIAAKETEHAAQENELARFRLTNEEQGRRVQEMGQQLAAKDQALAAKDEELTRLGLAKEEQMTMLWGKEDELLAGHLRAAERLKSTEESSARSYAELGEQLNSRLFQVKQVPARGPCSLISPDHTPCSLKRTDL